MGKDTATANRPPTPVWDGDPPPKDWEDGPAVEAWTNRQLDKRTDWFLKPGLRLQIGMLDDLVVFIEGKEELAAGFVDDPLGNRVRQKRLRAALTNKDFAALNADPAAKEALSKKNHPGGRNGDPSLTETYYLRHEAIRELVREIWSIAFKRQNRGRKTPPSLNVIVMRRLMAEPEFKENKIRLNRKKLNLAKDEEI